jgi:hypothetical protein
VTEAEQEVSFLCRCCKSCDLNPKCFWCLATSRLSLTRMIKRVARFTHWFGRLAAPILLRSRIISKSCKVDLNSLLVWGFKASNCGVSWWFQGSLSLLLASALIWQCSPKWPTWCLARKHFTWSHFRTLEGNYIQKGTPLECCFDTVPLHLHWQFLLGTSTMSMSLLCHHWQFLLSISAMAIQNKSVTRPTLCHYFPLGRTFVL